MTTRRNILITGASSGLGKGMAIEFAKKGRNLALCARRVDRLQQLRDELLAIKGVGEKKASRYGPSFLEEIERYSKETAG